MRFALFISCLFALASARGQKAAGGTALTFTMTNDSITVRVGPWSLRSSDTADLNRFVDAHLREIDGDKIMIYSDTATKYPAFATVIKVIRKNDWLRFQLVTIDGRPRPKVAPVSRMTTMSQDSSYDPMGDVGVDSNKGFKGVRLPAALGSPDTGLRIDEKVAIDVTVDTAGKVIKAAYQKRGSTTSKHKYVKMALRRAYLLKFSPGALGSKGTVIFKFHVFP